jgi:hypothetical protein
MTDIQEDEAPIANAASSDSLAPPSYSDIRLSKVIRNNDKLFSLGLISAHERDVSILRAKGFDVESEEENDDGGDDGESASGSEYGSDDDGDDNDDKVLKRKRSSSKNKKTSNSRRRNSEAPREGTRKSNRIRGIMSDGVSISVDIPLTHEEIEAERSQRVIICREARLKAAQELADLGYSAAEMKKNNPTATYEHCAMRVQTMSEKALGNRIKVIENAAGKHCIVKMAIFKSCLQDEGMWDLADKAKESLERLMRVVDGGEEGEEEEEEGGQKGGQKGKEKGTGKAASVAENENGMGMNHHHGEGGGRSVVAAPVTGWSILFVSICQGRRECCPYKAPLRS